MSRTTAAWLQASVALACSACDKALGNTGNTWVSFSAYNTMTALAYAVPPKFERCLVLPLLTAQLLV